MSVPVRHRPAALLRYIAGYQRAFGGVSPSLQECAGALGLGAKSEVHRLLTRLEERGLIRRLPKRKRAIELLVAAPIPAAPDGAPLYAVPVRLP